jgi:hypothetical protein
MFKIIMKSLSLIIVCFALIHFAQNNILNVFADSFIPFNGAVKVPENSVVTIKPVQSMGNIPATPPVHPMAEIGTVCGENYKVANYKILRNIADIKVIDPKTDKLKSTYKMTNKGIIIDINDQGLTLLPNSDLIIVNIQNVSGSSYTQNISHYIFYDQSVDFPAAKVIAKNNTLTAFFYVALQNKDNKEYFLYLRCNDDDSNHLRLGKYKDAYSTWSLPIANLTNY